MFLHENSHDIYFIKLDSLTTDRSLKTQPSYSDTLLSPLKPLQDVILLWGLPLVFVAVEQWEHSNIPKKKIKSENVEKSVKLHLIQSTTSRILMAQIK